jgi:ABC-2 type transport system permease protein
LPLTPAAAAGYAVSLVLAYLISLMIWLVVGMGGFWMTSTQGLRFLLSTIQSFLSGAVVPLWFLPDVLRTVLQLLPFQGMAFLPLSIFVGQATGIDILVALGIQLFWVVVLALMAAFVWRRAQWKLVVQGG